MISYKNYMTYAEWKMVFDRMMWGELRHRLEDLDPTIGTCDVVLNVYEVGESPSDGVAFVMQCLEEGHVQWLKTS